MEFRSRYKLIPHNWVFLVVGPSFPPHGADISGLTPSRMIGGDLGKPQGLPCLKDVTLGASSEFQSWNLLHNYTHTIMVSHGIFVGHRDIFH